MQIRTIEVHAGREELSELGVHASPIDLSTTYPLPNAAEGTEALDAFARGELSDKNPVYTRLYNPTVGRFEQALAELEGADTSVAFSSGMAAITAPQKASCSRVNSLARFFSVMSIRLTISLTSLPPVKPGPKATIGIRTQPS